MKCIHLDHKEHSEFFKNYWEGIELLQKEMKDMYATVEANIECVKGHKIRLECKVYKTAQIKKDLQDQASVLRKLLNETEEHIRNIESNYEGHDIILGSYQKSIESCNIAVKLVTPDKINDLEYDVCKEYIKFKELVTKSNHQASESCKLQFDVPPFVPDPHFVQHTRIVKPIQNARHLLKVKHVTDVKVTELNKYNHQIHFLGDHLGCVVNSDPYHVACLDKNGAVVKKYFPEKNSHICGFELSPKEIFIAQKHGVTVIPLGHEGERKFYLKNIAEHGKILHVNDSTVLISNWETDGSVKDWNYLLNTFETRLTKLEKPFYMTKIYTETGEVYVVCEWGSNRVTVYDSQWKQMGNMGGKGSGDGQLDLPHAITGTERGTILVSDLVNSRICHFTLDGKFINTV